MSKIGLESDTEELISDMDDPVATNTAHTELPLDEKPLGLRKKAVFRQFLIVFIANLSTLPPAMSLGYPSSIQAQVENKTDPFHLNETEFSWFASINAIACPVGGLLCAYLLDKFGRKPTLFIINFTSIVSWGLMGSAYYPNWLTKFVQVMVARFIVGIASGLASSAVSVYSAEICHQNFRGRLTLGSSAATATGIFTMFAFGYFIRKDWRLLAQIACGFSVLAFLLTFLIPESPTWLIVNNRIEEAKKSLRFFKGLKTTKNAPYSSEFENDFSVLQDSLSLAEGESKLRFSEAVRAPEFYKPLLIMIGFFAFQQFAGIFVIVVYAVQISIEAGVTIDSILCAMIVAFIRVPTTFAVGLVLDRWGRRPPAMFSGFGMAASMFILAACGWFPRVGAVPQLPFICICMYIFTSTLGIMTLPFSMIGEVFPQRMRGTAAGITISCNYTLSFLCVKIYPDMVNWMGVQNVFAFYGAASFLAVVYIYVFLPETKGKTLVEISEEFKGSRTLMNIE